jgi:hypothetical protein
VTAEREGGHAAVTQGNWTVHREDDLYYTDYGFGLVRPTTTNDDDQVYQRTYQWNERNQMTESRDRAYTMHYRYGADGQRAVKYSASSGHETLYFNTMWQMSNGTAEWLQSKHIYLGEERIATKYNSEGNDNTNAEEKRTYYYHSDHLGSAQLVTNSDGQMHERLEYTPYGELWINWHTDTAKEDSTPYRFTGKERDEETGLYYYGYATSSPLFLAAPQIRIPKCRISSISSGQ